MKYGASTGEGARPCWIFENAEFGSIRTLEINNEPYFVGKDVAEVLGYSNTRDALNKFIDKEDKVVLQKSQITTLDIPNRGLTIINESGLYSCHIFIKKYIKIRINYWHT